jgi:hypothetical protein
LPPVAHAAVTSAEDGDLSAGGSMAGRRACKEHLPTYSRSMCSWCYGDGLGAVLRVFNESKNWFAHTTGPAHLLQQLDVLLVLRDGAHIWNYGYFRYCTWSATGPAHLFEQVNVLYVLLVLRNGAHFR